MQVFFIVVFLFVLFFSFIIARKAFLGQQQTFAHHPVFLHNFPNFSCN